MEHQTRIWKSKSCLEKRKWKWSKVKEKFVLVSKQEIWEVALHLRHIGALVAGGRGANGNLEYLLVPFQYFIFNRTKLNQFKYTLGSRLLSCFPKIPNQPNSRNFWWTSQMLLWYEGSKKHFFSSTFFWSNLAGSFVWPAAQTPLLLSCKWIGKFSSLNCSAVNFPFLSVKN